MKKIYIILLCISVVFGCQDKSKKPEGILSHEEMVKVLADVYIAEQKVVNLSLGIDSSQQVFNAMKGKVFEQTGVPDSVFKKSIDYYLDRPRELEQIYGVLVDSLQLREQRTQ